MLIWTSIVLLNTVRYAGGEEVSSHIVLFTIVRPDSDTNAVESLGGR